MTLQTPSSQASRGFVLAYGDAMVQWSNLEVILALWFRKVTLIKHWEMAQAVFFSAKSFQGRSEMLTAALSHVPEGVEFKPFLQEAVLKTIGYNGVRNKIAHGVVHGGGQDATVRNAASYWDPGDVTEEHLKAASANFAELRRILYAAYKGLSKQDGGQPLEECLERLRKLPNEACSTQLSQRQKGRERQRQAALRKKQQSPK